MKEKVMLGLHFRAGNSKLVPKAANDSKRKKNKKRRKKIFNLRI